MIEAEALINILDFLILDLAFYTEVIMNLFQILRKKKEVSFESN